MPVLRRVVRCMLALSLVMPVLQPSIASAATSYIVGGSWPRPIYHMNGAAGVTADAQGNVYVADTGNHRVVRFGVNGGALSWGGLGNTVGKMKDPMDVALSPDGQWVYVADTGNNRIQVFNSSGVYATSWGRAGGPDLAGTGPKEFYQPKGICVDGSGNVYVADTGNSRVQKFNAAGGFLKMWGSPGSEDTQFYAPVGIEAGPTGDVFVVDNNLTNCDVRRFTAEGSFVTRWGGLGTLPGFLNQPWGIAIADDGLVAIADMDNNRIQTFTDMGVPVKRWGVNRPGDYSNDGQPCLKRPKGICFLKGERQTLLVCDSMNSRLREFDTDGGTIGIRGSWGDAMARFRVPSGITVGPDGSVFVAEKDNPRLQKFGAGGDFELGAPEQIPAPPRVDNRYFKSPTGVAVDTEGNAYVSEAGNHRVQKLSPGFEYLTKWGQEGTGDGWFKAPGGIACTQYQGATRVYVADTGNNRIQVFSSSGAFVTKWGTAGSGDGQMSAPEGVAIAPDGSVYVADTGNSRILRFGPNGDYRGKWGSAGTGNGQFISPTGLTVSAEGDVLVCDTGNDRIQRFTSTGTHLYTWGTTGADPGYFESPRGISVNSSGIVYVADTGNHRIQYFLPPVGVSISGVAQGGAYSGTVVPRVNFYGVALTLQRVLLNGSSWTPVPLGEDGSYTIDAYATDASGDSAAQTVSFVIDTVPPSTSCDAVASYDDIAQVNLLASDDRSGVNVTYYRLDGAAPKSGTSLSVTSAGSHRLEYWSADKAGNEEPVGAATFTVRDNLPPVTTSDAQASYANSAVIRLSAVDAGSQVQSVYYCLDDGPTISGTTVSTSQLGVHTLKYWAVDRAGNTEPTHTASFSVKRASRVIASAAPVQLAYGGTTSVAASLVDASGRLITGPRTMRLLKSFDGATWSVVGDVASATGKYSRTERIYRRTYFKWVFPGDVAFHGSSAAASALSRAKLTPPVAPSAAPRNRAIPVGGYVLPRHTAGTQCVRLQAFRYERGRWVLRSTGIGMASNYGGYSRYRGTLVFRYSGRWRVRAYHSDGDHIASVSGFDYLTVR